MLLAKIYYEPLFTDINVHVIMGAGKRQTRHVPF
jgi:hypothetical protein